MVRYIVFPCNTDCGCFTRDVTSEEHVLTGTHDARQRLLHAWAPSSKLPFHLTRNESIMLSSCQGRRSRRYLFLALFIVTALLLLHAFRPQDSYWVPKIGSFTYIRSSYDWGRVKIHHPPENIKTPPSGPAKSLPRIQVERTKAAGDEVTLERRTAIREAFVKSWDSYRQYAWGQDELMPLSLKGKQTFSGWAAQIVDALDILWILDMKDDFRQAVEVIATIDWDRTSDDFLNLFEVTIRHLGGLLAAYDLSGEPVLLAKAVELGDMLYAGFDTPNRLPNHWLNFNAAKKGRLMADDWMSGAAGCSLSLEFTRLSQITGDPKYYDATERVKQFIYRNQNNTRIPGLWPTTMNYRDETVDHSQFTLGSGADSLYEYLPKMHALLGGLDPEYAQMTKQSLDTAVKHLLYRPMNPQDRNILMAGNALKRVDNDNELSPEMQHLTCFIGGTYALAGKLLSRPDFVDLGSRLTAGCVWAYDAFPTNIMPEVAMLEACESIDGKCLWADHPVKNMGDLPDGFKQLRDPRYMLRPEAIESVFYMWRITGDEEWRDAAWRMWEGIVKETETDKAFATISDVNTPGSEKEDSMEVSVAFLSFSPLLFDDKSLTKKQDILAG